ncbi:MAG: hypothetical protein GF370_02875 [Candidatus Nealsonbacteria bacterium]|nr:hypothetical protein [Candidatus Nealsonbacteria bacterium]
MDQIITEEKVKKIRKVPGEVRGLALKNYGEYIFQKHEKEGLQKLEQTLRGLGCLIEYKKIRTMSFYPLWWSALSFVAIEQLFHYDGQKFQEMGRFCFKLPNLIRIWLKYLVSIEKAANSASKMYSMMLTVGEITVPEFNEEEKYVVIRMNDYPIYPVDFPRAYCHFLIGYYSSIIQIVSGGKAVGSETKCVYNGDDYHEFLIKW